MRLFRLVAFFAIYTCLIALAYAEEPNQPKTIDVFIPPECKWMYYGVFDRAEALKLPSYVSFDSSKVRPRTYKDPRSSISFYVESDGRHLAAIDSDGKLLWVRNPFEETPAFCPYRTPRPVIVKIEPFELPEPLTGYLKRRIPDVTHKFLIITFDSSQFGFLDTETGDFIEGGQN
jgi:hypothetical protein